MASTDYAQSTAYDAAWSGAAPPEPATVVRRSGEGEARWFNGMLAIIKATTSETAGQSTVLEIIAPPGATAPLHIHHAECEHFFVMEGSVLFEVGDATVQAGPGDFLIGPRDVSHRFTVGDQGARMLWTLTPGGFDGFVRDASEPAAELAPPPQRTPTEAELERLVAVAAAHQITVLPG